VLRIDEGLYGPAGVPMTWRRRLMAAVLVAPPGSLVSHRALAHLLGAGGFDTPPRPEVSIPKGGSLRRAGIVVHESTDLDLAHPQYIDGIPCTGTARLAMDLGAVTSERRYRQTLRELQHQHGVSSDRPLRTYSGTSAVAATAAAPCATGSTATSASRASPSPASSCSCSTPSRSVGGLVSSGSPRSCAS
jgi:hypothetical protein